MGLDADGLQDIGGERRDGCGVGFTAVNRGGGRGVDIGDVSVEEGVGVHEIGSRHGNGRQR